MNKKSIGISIVIILMSCLLSSSLIGVFLANSYAENQYELLSELTQHMITKYPEDEQHIIELIKKSTHFDKVENAFDKEYLSSYGFEPKDFALKYRNSSILIAVICTSFFLFLLSILILTIRKNCKGRIYDLTQYLEKINREKDVTILSCIEDDISPLQDEIYKTVTELRVTKEAAIKERKNFADNLANISHQIKTPVASISIMTQLFEKDQKQVYIEQIKKQTMRLEQLVEALLTLSKIDAGVLKLEKREVDIYSMLQLSVEFMEELIRRKEIQISIPNHSEITFWGDMEWSIEAVINLIKNCAEHTPVGGLISIDYEENPLYIEIVIKDSGEGFSEKELPHIFQRFYQGERCLKSGIGIGLSLAKAIIEMQNGFISAKNLQQGGACFTIRFYSH